MTMMTTFNNKNRIKVGLIGVGKMGVGISKSLLRHKVDLFIYSNNNRDGINKVLKEGGKEVSSPEKMAEICDYIILSLPSTREVLEVSNKFKNILQKKLIIIDTTTGDPDQSIKLSEKLKNKGIIYSDAPLTRGPQEAALGKLNSVFSCPENIISDVKTILDFFCETIIYVGNVGNGQKIKLINNALSMSVVAITSEIIQMSNSLDIDLNNLKNLISQGGVNNRLTQVFFEWYLDNNSNNLEFSIGNALKDLDYCLGIFEPNESQLEVLKSTRKVFKRRSSDGLSEKFLTAILPTELIKLHSKDQDNEI